MATTIWPAPSSQDELEREEKQALANELAWLLKTLHDSLPSLKEGFLEIVQLLAPTEHGSTLPLSSHRSESVKGILTRSGTRIPKGSIALRLITLPPPKGSPSYPLIVSQETQAPTLILPQILDARNRINACLDVVDATSWAGDATDATFVAGQLALLDVNITAAKEALRGGIENAIVSKPWYTSPPDAASFSPPLPPNLSVHLSIVDASLTLEIRTLEPVTTAGGEFHSPFNFRGTIGAVFGAQRPVAHDEEGEVFMYRGQEVRVREKVRVESADPSLMAVVAKLTALERSVGHARSALDVVMGKEDS